VREIANKETTITEKTSHTPNTQMLIKGDGGSSGKLNTQLKMKRVPSSQKMDKVRRFQKSNTVLFKHKPD